MNFDEMTTSDIEKRISTVTESLASVRTQLDFAKSKTATTGVFSNREWFNRARHAMRMMGREHQLLLCELGKRRKTERRAGNDSMEKRFMDVAKRRLSPELFSDMVAEAEG